MSSRKGVKYDKLQTTDQVDQKEGSSPTKWTNIWRGINLVMFLFFSCAAVVQLNDPDPVLWIPLYLFPGFLSLAIAVNPNVTENKAWRIACVIDLGVSIVVAVYSLVLLLQFVALENPLQHEEGREFAGTLVIIFWVSICRFTYFGSNNPTKGVTNALLLITCIIALLPFGMWSMCFVDKLDQFGH